MGDSGAVAGMLVVDVEVEVGLSLSSSQEHHHQRQKRFSSPKHHPTDPPLQSYPRLDEFEPL